MKHTRRNRISPRTKWIRDIYAEDGWPPWRRISRCRDPFEAQAHRRQARRAHPDEPPVRRRRVA